ncbi:sulfatase-like hydrolase/transferase [Lunatimonas salinarum]|uniref:sulfatase-like hydrolase/transferase n=1 Tax=Lunatimonas salinarum TaxID=1774590 RepID=UPI001ADF738E|nr:sulfatase-like hydrolase/transferase [Lunatimonas salinarum]
MRIYRLAVLACLALIVLHVQAQDRNLQPTRPNIIVLLADDLGYGDLGGFFGGNAHTPHINALAAEGMLFTDFHSNGAMCSPTRAALLTGRYQQRVGIEDPLAGDWQQKGVGAIKGIACENVYSAPTMADYLKRAGYATAFFGKWHLGNHPSANPLHFGFDEFRGLTSGDGDYFTKLDRHGYPDWWHNKQLHFQKGYTTDVITDNAILFIEKHKNQPFFVYLAHLGVHFPWQSPADAVLETRVEGNDYTSSLPGPSSKLGPHSPAEVPNALIAMIEALDHNVGKLMNYLKAAGLDQNTLLFFTADNGQYLRYQGNTWPEVGSNGLLRGEKADLYEGGHRVPSIAWWPGNIAAGSRSEATLASFDLLPTFLELTGQPLPDPEGADQLDGQSFVPVLLSRDTMPERILFWRTPEAIAVRQGPWKLLEDRNKGKLSLYNLQNDLGETRDLKAAYPQLVTELIHVRNTWELEMDGTK